VTGDNVYPIAPGFPFPDPVVPPAPASLAGHRLPGSAKYTLRLGGEYSMPLAGSAKLVLNGDVYISGDMFFDPYERSTTHQPAYQTYNASATWNSGKGYSVMVWGRNLSNATVISNQIITDRSFAYPRVTYLQDPRTFGATLKLNY
jgi:iron complex outermembrane receptor protein